jgi:hypothetical protein
MNVLPLRLYALAVAVVALVAHYVPSLPSELFLAVVAALIGVGETLVRRVDYVIEEAAEEVPELAQLELARLAERVDVLEGGRGV